MAADVSHEICKAYGVEHATESVAYRASIVIDTTKTVRIKHVNDLPVGRNMMSYFAAFKRSNTLRSMGRCVKRDGKRVQMDFKQIQKV
jgi:alkyl hydroperoxide reductase subunit AhpC